MAASNEETKERFGWTLKNLVFEIIGSYINALRTHVSFYFNIISI